MSLGRNIAKLRTERGLTQRELAKHSGISESYLRRIETEHYSVPIKTLTRIAVALGVSLNEIFKYRD